MRYAVSLGDVWPTEAWVGEVLGQRGWVRTDVAAAECLVFIGETNDDEGRYEYLSLEGMGKYARRTVNSELLLIAEGGVGASLLSDLAGEFEQTVDGGCGPVS